MANIDDIAAPATKMTAVECSMLPTPTSGETMPPARKHTVPSSAEAAPARSRSLLSASVVDAVNVSPIMNMSMNSEIS